MNAAIRFHTSAKVIKRDEKELFLVLQKATAKSHMFKMGNTRQQYPVRKGVSKSKSI